MLGFTPEMKAEIDKGNVHLILEESKTIQPVLILSAGNQGKEVNDGAKCDDNARQHVICNDCICNRLIISIVKLHRMLYKIDFDGIFRKC